MILVLAGVTAFYFIYAEAMAECLYVMGAIGIGVLFLLFSTVLMLIADCVLGSHEWISRLLRVLAALFSVASIAAVAMFFHFNISVFSAGVEYWIITLFGFCSVVQASYRRVNSFGCKLRSGVLAALSPVVGLILAMVFCAASYFLVNWIVTLREFDSEVICILYFWISVGAVIIFNIILSVISGVFKVVFGGI